MSFRFLETSRYNIQQQLEAQNWSQAVVLCHHMLQRFPDKIWAYQYQGLALRELRNYTAAEQAFKIALNLAPKNISSLNHLGRLYQRQQSPEQALIYFQEALDLLPNDHPARARIRFNQALCWLALGEYKQGFKAYLEKRFTGDDPPPPVQIPYYQGESLLNKTLLIQSTEGLGDAIFLLPLMIKLNHQGVRLKLLCQSPLITLFQNTSIFESIRPTETRQMLKPLTADYYLPLYALPYYLQLKPEQLPLYTKYLKTLPPLNTHIPNNTQIGLVWKCNPNSPSFMRRSLALSELIQYLPDKTQQDKTLTYHSLQVGLTPEESLQLQHTPVITLETEWVNFAQTSKALDNIDLLISVDTATAHLAAAMGKTVWLLLAYESDWRWQLAHTHSPWYPSIHIFRQTSPGDWISVLREVQRALQGFNPKTA